MIRRYDFALRDGAIVDTAARVTLGQRRPVALELANPQGAFRQARLEGDYNAFVDEGRQ